MNKSDKSWSELTDDEKVSLCVGLPILIGLIILLFVTIVIPVGREQTIGRLKAIEPRSYYYTKEAGGKVFILKHDPLAEQEGGLRTISLN